MTKNHSQLRGSRYRNLHNKEQKTTKVPINIVNQTQTPLTETQTEENITLTVIKNKLEHLEQITKASQVIRVDITCNCQNASGYTNDNSYATIIKLKNEIKTLKTKISELETHLSTKVPLANQQYTIVHNPMGNACRKLTCKNRQPHLFQTCTNNYYSKGTTKETLTNIHWTQ